MTVTLQLASGRVFAEDPQGAVRLLQAGGELAPGEVVVTGSASAAVFHVTDGGEVSVGASVRWDPALGAPGGDSYQPASELQALQADELGVASHHVDQDPSVSLADLFQCAAPASTALEAAKDEMVSDRSETEWMSELAGLVRALQALSGHATAELADLQEQVAAVQAELAAGPVTPADLEDAVGRLFVSLDRAEGLAYREFARHAGEEISLMARGDGGLQADALKAGVSPVAATSSAPVLVPEPDADVLHVHSILSDLAVESLGDVLQLESIAGATRMTVREAAEDEGFSLWLNLPRGGMAGMNSLLGYDAPEFGLPDTA